VFGEQLLPCGDLRGARRYAARAAWFGLPEVEETIARIEAAAAAAPAAPDSDAQDDADELDELDEFDEIDLLDEPDA